MNKAVIKQNRDLEGCQADAASSKKKWKKCHEHLLCPSTWVRWELLEYSRANGTISALPHASFPKVVTSCTSLDLFAGRWTCVSVPAQDASVA